MNRESSKPAVPLHGESILALPGAALPAIAGVLYVLSVEGGHMVPEWVAGNIGSLLGHSAAEAMSPTWWLENIHRDDRAGALAASERLLTAGSVRHEYRFRAGDGSWRWIQDQGALQTDAHGGPLRVVGYWMDVTASRTMRNALDTSEQRFRATFEQAVVGVALIAPDGRWLEVNRRLCETLGYTREELQACTFAEITGCLVLFPQDADEGGIPVTLGTVPASTREVRHVRKDGRIVWLNLAVGPVCGADGTVAYLVAVVKDISRRKAAEAELAERLHELTRWQAVTLKREERVQALKAEVNELLREAGRAPRYGDPPGPLTSALAEPVRDP